MLLCSLTGDIFPKEQQSHQLPGNSSVKNEHLRQMLQMVGVWVADPQAAVHQAAANEEASLLDACRLVGLLSAAACVMLHRHIGDR